MVFGKVDTEAEQQLAGAANITSIPTLMAFRDGILVFSQPGALPPQALEQVIQGVKGLDMDEVRSQIAAQQDDIAPGLSVDATAVGRAVRRERAGVVARPEPVRRGGARRSAARAARSTSPPARAATRSGWPPRLGGHRGGLLPGGARAGRRRPRTGRRRRLGVRRRADLAAGAEPYDLAVLAYLQLAESERRQAARTAFGCLRPGGTFFLVAHDSSNLTEGTGGPQDPSVLMTAEDVLADLGDASYDVVRADPGRAPGGGAGRHRAHGVRRPGARGADRLTEPQARRSPAL